MPPINYIWKWGKFIMYKGSALCKATMHIARKMCLVSVLCLKKEIMAMMNHTRSDALTHMVLRALLLGIILLFLSAVLSGHAHQLFARAPAESHMAAAQLPALPAC